MDAVTLALVALLQAVPIDGRVRPVTAPVRDAGVLHVATSTWTRKVGSASLGADVLYNNTCDDGYYSPLSGDTYVTNGRVPSPSSPTNLSSRPGCAMQYRVDGFEFAYCTTIAAPGTFTVDFFNSYGCCGTVIGVAPTGSALVAGVPGSASGALACWTVVVDLDTPPNDFVLGADRDGVYDGGPGFVDGFGWSIRSSLSGPASTTTGPLIASGAGCNTCGWDWDGTRWDSVIDYSESGSGMGTCSAIQIESGPATPGCYYFGGCPDPNFHLRVIGDACGAIVDDFGSFCVGDGTGAPCPCGNSSPPGEGVGCLSSLGIGGRLRAIGNASIAADTVVLQGDQMPPNAPTLYFQGTLQHNGGAGSAFGDGKRCAGGTATRLGVSANSSVGASRYPRPGDPRVSARGQVVVPGTRTYQAWFRNAAAFCTAATFNLTNGREITWAF